LLRPAEVDHLIGESTKARQKLGWTPEIDFRALVRMMVDADIRRWSEARSATPALR
jgi:GDPmannose 4,6-dehydratase